MRVVHAANGTLGKKVMLLTTAMVAAGAPLAARFAMISTVSAFCLKESPENIILRILFILTPQINWLVEFYFF